MTESITTMQGNVEQLKARLEKVQQAFHAALAGGDRMLACVYAGDITSLRMALDKAHATYRKAVMANYEEAGNGTR